MKEFKEELNYVKEQVDRLCRLAVQADSSLLWFYEACLDYWRREQKMLEQVIRKFSFYHEVSLGRSKEGSDERIAKAKMVELKDVIGAEPEHQFGNRWKYLCPLHSEKTPSFVWYKNQNTFHCFGCGKNGDVIDFVKLLFNVDFLGAIELLSKY